MCSKSKCSKSMCSKSFKSMCSKSMCSKSMCSRPEIIFHKQNLSLHGTEEILGVWMLCVRDKNLCECVFVCVCASTTCRLSGSLNCLDVLLLVRHPAYQAAWDIVPGDMNKHQFIIRYRLYCSNSERFPFTDPYTISQILNTAPVLSNTSPIIHQHYIDFVNTT